MKQCLPSMAPRQCGIFHITSYSDATFSHIPSSSGSKTMGSNASQITTDVSKTISEMSWSETRKRKDRDRKLSPLAKYLMKKYLIEPYIYIYKGRIIIVLVKPNPYRNVIASVLLLVQTQENVFHRKFCLCHSVPSVSSRCARHNDCIRLFE